MARFIRASLCCPEGGRREEELFSSMSFVSSWTDIEHRLLICQQDYTEDEGHVWVITDFTKLWKEGHIQEYFLTFCNNIFINSPPVLLCWFQLFAFQHVHQPQNLVPTISTMQVSHWVTSLEAIYQNTCRLSRATKGFMLFLWHMQQ